jgi:hypothetical protein
LRASNSQNKKTTMKTTIVPRFSILVTLTPLPTDTGNDGVSGDLCQHTYQIVYHFGQRLLALLAQALRGVGSHQNQAGLIGGRPNGRQLLKDSLAVPALINHPLHTPRLPLDAP